MALLKRNTQQALDAARREHTACEAEIGRLHAARAMALNDDADIDQLLSLDKQMTEQSGRLVVLQGKISTLESRLEREQSEQRQKDYAANVDRLEAELPKLEAPVRELSAAIKKIGDKVEALAGAQEAFRRNHLPGFLLPPFNLDRVRRALAAVVAADLDPARIREIAANFQDAEFADQKAHVENLRADAPQSETEQDQAA